MLNNGYVYYFENEITLPASIEETFAFLSDPESLPLLDPPWLEVQLLSAAPGPLAVGSDMEYIFRWSGLPVYLRIAVTEMEAPFHLVLKQAQGPWQRYVYTCTLRGGRSRTVVSERIQACARPGLFERVLHALVIRNQLRETLTFRGQALQRALERERLSVSHA